MMGIQLYNVFLLTQIRNYSRSISPSAGLLPKPFIQSFKHTFTSKKADPNVGHRCIIFKKAILASSTVFPSCLLYAAVMLCLEKDIKPIQLATGRFPMSSISTKNSIRSSPRSVFCPQQQNTVKMQIAYHAMGQGGGRTSPVFVTNELGEGSPGAQGNGFQGRGAI